MDISGLTRRSKMSSASTARPFSATAPTLQDPVPAGVEAGGLGVERNRLQRRQRHGARPRIFLPGDHRRTQPLLLGACETKEGLAGPAPGQAIAPAAARQESGASRRRRDVPDAGGQQVEGARCCDVSWSVMRCHDLHERSVYAVVVWGMGTILPLSLPFACSVSSPLPLAGEAGRGPLGVTGISRASPAASAGAEADPHPTSPASGRGACAAASQSCRSRVHLRLACRFIVPFHPVLFQSVPSVRCRPAPVAEP